MSPEESPSASPSQSGRRFQFSLLALFALMTTAAFAAAIYVNWNPVGRMVTLIGVVALFVAVRLAIHLRIGQE
jgi:hypothetical protein